MIGCVKKIHLHRSLPTACMPLAEASKRIAINFNKGMGA
jgi:hypothetical protein